MVTIVTHFLTIWVMPHVCVCEWSKVGDHSRGWLHWGVAEGHNSFPWITPLYPWYVSYNTKLSTIWVFGMTRPRIEPQFPRPLANTTHKANNNKESMIYLTPKPSKKKKKSEIIGASLWPPSPDLNLLDYAI